MNADPHRAWQYETEDSDFFCSGRGPGCQGLTDLTRGLFSTLKSYVAEIPKPPVSFYPLLHLF